MEEHLRTVGLHYFVGLDLGKRRDHSALAVVERRKRQTGERDWVTYRLVDETRYGLTDLERISLGTPYPRVVERVARLVRRQELAGRTTLFVDATGVGGAVVDMLKEARLGCTVMPVVITGGDRWKHWDGGWSVPREQLVAAMQMMLEPGELRIAGRLRERAPAAAMRCACAGSSGPCPAQLDQTNRIGGQG